MLKKIFCALFAAAIIFCGSVTVSAQDVPIESYSSRVKCYVMTETIYWTHPYECEATLKMVRPSDGNVQHLHYHFVSDIRSNARFENSQGFSGRVTRDYPIEWAMWDYIVRYSNQHKIR